MDAPYYNAGPDERYNDRLLKPKEHFCNWCGLIFTHEPFPVGALEFCTLDHAHNHIIENAKQK